MSDCILLVARILTSTLVVYWQRSLVVAWLMPRETAAVSAQVLCTPFNHTPVSPLPPPPPGMLVPANTSLEGVKQVWHQQQEEHWSGSCSCTLSPWGWPCCIYVAVKNKANMLTKGRPDGELMFRHIYLRRSNKMSNDWHRRSQLDYYSSLLFRRL